LDKQSLVDGFVLLVPHPSRYALYFRNRLPRAHLDLAFKANYFVSGA